MANAATFQPDHAAARLAMKRILTAAWMAVIAGVAVQLLVIVVRASAGEIIKLPASVAEITQSVVWSTLVCVAIAAGTLASEARPRFAGFAGLFAAPIAWAAAKGVQKGVQALLHLQQDQFTPLFWAICLWKGVEYGVLGGGLALLVGQPGTRATSYLAFGGLLGLLGGVVSVVLNIANAILTRAATLPPYRIAGLVAAEVFFAAACCFVIYMAQVMTRGVIGIKGG
jgi:hypothetical protein